jgi:hypothetical protein
MDGDFAQQSQGVRLVTTLFEVTGELKGTPSTLVRVR